MTTALIPRVVLLVAILTSLLPICIGSSRASYGEFCNKEIRCDSRNLLACSISGVCECFLGDSMTYDETTRKCVALAGERCQLTTIKGDNTWIVDLPCVTGGNCTSGVCDCLPGYFERSDGFCEIKRRHQENCTRNEMCNSAEHLTCGKDKTCVCDEDSGFLFENNECRILAGHSCGSDLKAHCISDSTCGWRKVCTCSPDRFQAANGTCITKKRKYDSCNSNTECMDTHGGVPTLMTCSDGQCKCNMSLAVDDTSSLNGFCVIPLGQPCTQNNCIKGAICTGGTCQCNTNAYFETENKTCEPRGGFNESCKNDLHCDISFKCDPNNKCVCVSGKAFSLTLKRCAVIAGKNCGRSYGYYDENRCSERCVPNASPENDESRRYDDEEDESYYNVVCNCNEGFTTSIMRGDGHCYATLNNYCDGDIYGPPTSKPCLPGLICRNGICKCMFGRHQTYSSATQSCRSHAGGPCTNSSDCADSNTECLGEDGMKICGCIQGSVQIGRMCSTSTATYGAKCDPGSQAVICDKGIGLECTSKGICECPFLQEFNGKECVGLTGALCSISQINEDVLCGEGSFCKPFRGLNQPLGLCTCLHGYKVTENRDCIFSNTTVNATLSSTIESTT